MYMILQKGQDPVKILHFPCNTPYVRKLTEEGALNIVNNETMANSEVIPDTVTFRWILDHAESDEFWQMFDICHVHYGFEFEQKEIVVSAMRLFKQRGKPVVYTCHELDSVHGKSAEEYREYQKIILDYSSVVITLTQGCKEDLKKCFPNVSATVIPHGYVVNPMDFRFRNEKKSKMELILFGSLRQNRDCVTSLINLSQGIVSECKVIWLTTPFSKAQIEELSALRALFCVAAKNHNVHIETILPLSNDDLAYRVSNADILLLPYCYAGHSGQLELAFDCGALPVVTNVGYLNEQWESLPKVDAMHRAFFCEWSDGKEWLYQTRLMQSVHEAMEYCSSEQLSIDIEARRTFRINQHKRILYDHRQIYLELKENT